MNKKIKVLLYSSLLISMSIVFTRFLSIETPITRIGFGFLPIAFSGIMFGPAIGGITAVLADIIGMMLFPKSAYFPGFTFSALIQGIIYGLLLYRKPKSKLRITIAVFIITLFVDLGLNSIWLSILTHKALIAIIIPRIIQVSLMFPIKIFSIYISWHYVGNFIETNYLKNTIHL